MIPRVILKKGGDKRISKGHLWVFKNEIKNIRGDPKPGDVVEVIKHNGEFLGLGFFNPNSFISVRLLTRKHEDINFEFFKRRILNAYNYRKLIYPDVSSYRLVHGESDLLPGLVVDKYEDIFSIQTFSYGMDRMLDVICDVIEDIFSPRGIVERNETILRKLEGLDTRRGVLRGKVDPVVISEYGVKFKVDVLNGQKTGFFLDQRENRKFIRNFIKGKKVLDCFTNEGGFALSSAFAGADYVIGIDISKTAIERARENANLNGLDVNFEVGDVFDVLRSFHSSGERFDVVILDPPSFAKSKQALKGAISGYREINSMAMKILNSGGILATASCSHHISDDMFLDVIVESASIARKTIRIIDWRGASPDHPVLPQMPETKYLKFVVLQVV